MPRSFRPHASVRGRLLGLLLLASVPVMLLAVLGGHALWRSVIDRAMHEVALERDQIVAVNRVALERTATMLRALAIALEADPSLCGTILAGASTPGLSFSLRDAAGAEICPERGTRLVGRDAGTALGVVDAAEVRLTLSHPVQGRPGPVTLSATLAPRGEREGRFYWLFDPRGGSRAFGATPMTVSPPMLPPGDEVFTTTTAEGTALLVATGTLTPGTRLAVAMPAAPVHAAALRMAALHLAELLALLALSATAVMLGAGYVVTRPLRTLRDAVRRWGAGARPFELPARADLPDELRELAESIDAGARTLAQRETELRAAIDHAELLAGEVHHRVKNNLQTVSSLLALQANRVADPAARAEFEAARDRVGALATLHRHLYVEHDPEAIDFGAFIAELGAQLFAAVGERPGGRITLDVEAPSLRIGTDQAVPLALVITEAVADALRQGFPEGRQGRLRIRLTSGEGRARLDVEDDGALPRPEDPLRALLLRGLGRQLGGTLKMEAGRVELDFPLRPPAIRQPVSLRPPTPPRAPSAPA